MKALTFSLFALFLSPFLASSARADFSLVGNCAGDAGKFVRGGRDGLDIKPSINAISAAAGKHLNLFSCYRSQETQNSILKSRGCAPFGNKDCSQTVARISFHTRTIAADIQNFDPNLTKQCQLIAKGRSVAGGRGGVGTYPGTSGHFDMGPARVWNKCRGVVLGDEGAKSPAVKRYRERQQAKGSDSNKSGEKCYRTASYPSCCGPVRAKRGLCTG